MPEIKLKGKVQDLNKVVKNEKERSSNFFLTINTNQQYKKDDPNIQNDIEVFETSIKSVLSKIDDYVTFTEGMWSDDYIKDVEIDYVIEMGTKKNQIHAHIMLKIKHSARIQLDTKKIKSKICSDLGLKNVYINNRLMKKDSSTNVLDYIHKYVGPK
jgi:hypothetical protein